MHEIERQRRRSSKHWGVLAFLGDNISSRGLLKKTYKTSLSLQEVCLHFINPSLLSRQALGLLHCNHICLQNLLNNLS